MKAVVGDRIVVVSAQIGSSVRDGRVVELRHADGSPPYLVEWSDTGQRALYFPGSDGHVEHLGTEEHAEVQTDPTEVALPHIRTWTVTLQVFELGAKTTARAVLHAGADRPLEATGGARRNPSDPDIPEIGDEVAVARALNQLADALMSAAYDDMAGVGTRE